MVNLTVAVTVRARGPLAADAAWERYARPATWPTWSPQIRRVECAHDRLAAGVTGRVIGPLGVAVPFVVDDWNDAARRWTWTVPVGPVELRLDHGVDGGDDGSSTYVRVHGPAPIVLPYLPLARWALHRLLR
jgi:hypothetical protein